jgi:hypothetical protein
MAVSRFRHLNVVQLLTHATTTGRHIEILYGVYRHLNMSLQLPLNNECRSRLVKTIDGNHVAYMAATGPQAAAAGRSDGPVIT